MLLRQPCYPGATDWLVPLIPFIMRMAGIRLFIPGKKKLSHVSILSSRDNQWLLPWDTAMTTGRWHRWPEKLVKTTIMRLLSDGRRITKIFGGRRKDFSCLKTIKVNG